MIDIHQTIKAGVESICTSCNHYPVCRAVDNQPCAECNQYATAVRHGSWELIGADKRGRGGILWCTACGECYPFECDYCPNCGARMDGAE